MSAKDHYSVKKEIASAFTDLMTEKSYMDITVTDIVTRAGVARVSFYRHFNSTSDVIDYIVEMLSEEFMEDILPTLTSRDERKWREFLFDYFYQFTRKQKKFALMSSQNNSVMFARMDNRMRLHEQDMPAQSIEEKYIIHGKLGLINSIAKKWVDGGMKETPEEMINYIMSFILTF